MSDNKYILNLEKQVEDLEELLLAHEAALEKAILYARDRNEQVKKIAEFFYSTTPTQKRLRKSLAFWNDNTLCTQSKFEAVPWKAITEAVDRLPTEEEIKKNDKQWSEILASYKSFEELQTVLQDVSKKLRGRSKELVDSCLQDVTMNAKYPVHFDFQ